MRVTLVARGQHLVQRLGLAVATRQSMLARDHHGPRAILNALERLAGGYDVECKRVQKDLGLAEAQRRDYQARLGAPFPHGAYLSGLTALRDQLKGVLSGATAAPGNEPLPAISGLVEQIKALKAAHTIEATPERTSIRHSSAEEPVTARIRRRYRKEASEVPPGLDGNGLGLAGAPTPAVSPKI
jgi:hypothetical protein